MKTWMKVASIALVAVMIVLAFGATTPANAQGNGKGVGKNAVQAVMDAVTQVTGLTNTDVLKELADGKSLNDIITEHKADPAAVKAAAKVTLTADINKAVTDGKLTQVQADKLIANLDTALDKALSRTFPNLKGSAKATLLKANAVGILFDETAKETKLSKRDLLQELRDGKTLAQVATAHSVDPKAIVDASVQQATKRLNVLVDKSKVKRDEADKLIAELPTYFTQKMNEVNPLGSKGGKKDGSNNPQPTAQPTAAATPSL